NEKIKLIEILSCDTRYATFKDIIWRRRKYKILCQHEWGPCWIISILNSYILLNKINFDRYENDSISIIDLIKKLAIILTESEYISYHKLDDDIKKYCLKLFTNFHQWSQRGIGVNCHFSSCANFGKCDIMNIIEACGLKLYHCMTPNLNDSNLNELVIQHNYTSLYNYCLKINGQSFKTHNSVNFKEILNFLNLDNQNFLNADSYSNLNKCIKNKSIIILYHNHHFWTIIKEADEIYLLLTDLKYSKVPKIVFKKLRLINKNEFYDGNYRMVGETTRHFSYYSPIKMNSIKLNFFINVIMKYNEKYQHNFQHYISKSNKFYYSPSVININMDLYNDYYSSKKFDNKTLHQNKVAIYNNIPLRERSPVIFDQKADNNTEFLNRRPYIRPELSVSTQNFEGRFINKNEALTSLNTSRYFDYCCIITLIKKDPFIDSFNSVHLEKLFLQKTHDCRLTHSEYFKIQQNLETSHAQTNVNLFQRLRNEEHIKNGIDSLSYCGIINIDLENPFLKFSNSNNNQKIEMDKIQKIMNIWNKNVESVTFNDRIY
ncbi:hypothetical protein HZS_1355, partial [Henneguya salminicola]